MNCRKVSHLLSAYIDCELPGIEQLQMQRHLRECTQCTEEYEALLATKRMLSRLSMKPPCDDMESRIMGALEREQASRRRVRGVKAWWSVLNERQRRQVRVTGLCGALCSVSIMFAFARIGNSLDAPLSVPGAGLTPAAQIAVQPPSPILMPSAGQLAMPGPELVLAHDSWSDAQPVHPGVSVAPLAPAFRPDLFGLQAPPRGR